MPPQFLATTYKFGYEKDNPSCKYLKHKVLGAPKGGEITETFYTLNLENAKTFFADNLQRFHETEGLPAIEKLFKRVTQNLMFNLHEIQADSDVFVAFETMNNRGKKLSNLELLKNRLIYLTTLYTPEELSEDERIILRQEINEAWREVYYHLGRNRRRPLPDDDFLQAHWIIYFQYRRRGSSDYLRFLLEEKFTASNVFNKMEISLTSITPILELNEEEGEEDDTESAENEQVMYAGLAPKEISDYVKNLKTTATHWYNSYNPTDNQDVSAEEH